VGTRALTADEKRDVLALLQEHPAWELARICATVGCDERSIEDACRDDPAWGNAYLQALTRDPP
jgi:hypothetical protein